MLCCAKNRRSESFRVTSPLKRETSFNFLVTRFMEEMFVPVHFVLPLIFTLVAASISHFLSTAI